MSKFAISAAMIAALVILSASVPANAEYSSGGPIHRNDGKCFTYSRFMVRDGSFGFWSDCAKAREFGCSEAGLTKFGYWGGDCAGGANTTNNKGAQPAIATNNPRRALPRSRAERRVVNTPTFALPATRGNCVSRVSAGC